MGEIIYKKRFRKKPKNETEQKIVSFADSASDIVPDFLTSIIGMSDDISSFDHVDSCDWSCY